VVFANVAHLRLAALLCTLEPQPRGASVRTAEVPAEAPLLDLSGAGRLLRAFASSHASDRGEEIRAGGCLLLPPAARELLGWVLTESS
jgi:hypothetical protein